MAFYQNFKMFYGLIIVRIHKLIDHKFNSKITIGKIYLKAFKI